MLTLITTLSSLLVCRFRSRATLELEIVALRHQLAVLRRQQPGRPKLTSLDRLLWVWLYRAWPRCLKVMVLVKSATVVQWCMSSEPFGQVSNRFKRGSGSSELKLWLRTDDAAGVVARWF
jgi:hypothetical protein